jgi:tetratricopeptide (TPR) repeat protein
MAHPKSEEIVLCLRSAASVHRNVLIHVLECAECRQRALDALHRQGTQSELADVLQYRRPGDPASRQDDLAATFRRVFSRALACAESEQQRAQALFDELMSHPAQRRGVLVRNSDRFRSLALAQRVLEASRDACFEDARRGEELARLALVIIAAVDADLYGHRLVADLTGRAWAYVGNALRLANDLDGAQRAFDVGLDHVEGTSDPMEEAGFLHLLASLRKHQRRFDEAAELLHRSGELYAEVGDDEKLARTLTSLGSQYLDQGCAEKARQPLLEALRRVDPESDPRTALYVHHNLTLCLTETGRFLEAQRMFRNARRFYAQFPDRVTRLHSRWLEGIIAAGTGRGERAEKIFLQVRDAFLAAELPYDAALVGMELAALYASQGRHADLRELAEDLTPVFFSYHLHRDALAALAFFVQAAQREGASMEVVERVADYLKRSRHDPGLPFQPSR